MPKAVMGALALSGAPRSTQDPPRRHVRPESQGSAMGAQELAGVPRSRQEHPRVAQSSAKPFQKINDFAIFPDSREILFGYRKSITYEIFSYNNDSKTSARVFTPDYKIMQIVFK